jgi:hypothetical protein
MYYDLGPDKCLNEIVLAGSHDAGVTSGGGNTKTQGLDIYEQALSGVRLFDLRITGCLVKSGNANDVLTLKAYHGKGPESNKSGILMRTDNIENIKVKSMWAGSFGMGLSTILSDAKKFVLNNNSEFLILKFDKCKNWLSIADACVEILGDSIHKEGGNINTMTLRQLRGKVIVLFSGKGSQAVHHRYGIPHGILTFKNMKKETGNYSDKFHGMQYFGSGGTKLWKPFNKVKQNIKNQTKLMAKGGDGNPQVMGMMYWTTTGINESIKDRNSGMWTPPNVAKLKQMWENGLEASIESRNNTFRKIDGFDSSVALKAFMPNIVMIDFADINKCYEIFGLNTMSPTFLVHNIQNFKL